MGWRQKYDNYFTKPEMILGLTAHGILTGVEAIKTRLHEIDESKWTKGQKWFFNRLDQIENQAAKLADQLETIATGWKEFNEQLKELEIEGRSRNIHSALKSIVVHVYQLGDRQIVSLDEWAEQLKDAPIGHFMSIPFKIDLKTKTKKKNNTRDTRDTNNTKDQKPKRRPVNLTMAKKYFIKRQGNNEQLTKLLRNDGAITLTFQKKNRSWRETLEVIVPATDKIKQILKEPKVGLQLIRLLQPEKPSGKVRVQLTFEGPTEAFVAIKHLKMPIVKQLKQILPPADVVGVDLNRREEYALISSLGLFLPDEITKVGERWKNAQEQVAFLQGKAERTPIKYKQKKFTLEKELHEKRVVNLRRDYHFRLVNWLGQQLIACQAKRLILEDLEESTRGTRGFLAKAIDQMADDHSLYAREALAITLFSGKPFELIFLCPFNSSSTHLGCGGTLDRARDHYDIAPCKKCGSMVNTHFNAALWLVVSYLTSLKGNESISPREKNCLPLINLSSPP